MSKGGGRQAPMWCQDAEYVGLARNGEWHYHAMGVLLMDNWKSWSVNNRMMAVDCEHCGWWHKVKVSS